jgi:acyl-CoA thioesterase FadM
MDSDPPLRYVTASLHVDFLAPTPLGCELEIRGSVREITDKKVVVDATLTARGVVCATGRVVAVQLPESMLEKMKGETS